VEEGIWKEEVRKDTSAKGLGSCYRVKEGIHTKKGESVFAVKGREKGSIGICRGPIKKRVYLPSKLSQTSPVYFVAKKDRTRRIVQDYCHINQWTIKNGYPLPLIVDILDGVGKRKVFTKLDLRWGYNNVRIKEGDE